MNTLDFRTFNADWIWNGEKDSINSYVRFVHEFESEDLDDVKLLISADTNYAAYINGKLAGYEQYNDYPFYKVYNEHTIGGLLKKGKNRLCIHGYYQGVDSSTYYKSDAGIIFAVLSGDKVLAASGKETLTNPCPSYISGPMENVSGQLSFTFKYNAAEDDGWLDENYSFENWQSSEVVNKDLNLYPRPIKKLMTLGQKGSKLCAQGLFIRENKDCDVGLLMLTDYLSARRIPEISDWEKTAVKLPGAEPFCIKKDQTDGKGAYLVFDLDSEEAGLLNIDLETSEGTVFEIGYGEHLDDLRVRSYITQRNFACRYVSKGGRQSFTHYFKRVACRYVQLNISNINDDVKIYYAGVLPVRYPLSENSIDIKDFLHKRIYDISVRTLKLNMHEHYEDCPWREQALYAMDSRNQALCGYYSFSEFDFPESSIRLLGLSLGEDGMLELCAPARIEITIPSFSFNWVMELYEFWKHGGRIEFVKEMFETVEKICSSALSRMEDGVLPRYKEPRYWNFYEWAEGLDGAPLSRNHELDYRVDAPLNMFFIVALDSAAQLAAAIGKTKLSEYWLNCAENLRVRTRESLYDSETGLYYTYSNKKEKWHHCELAQSLAIYSGCAKGEEAEKLRRILADKNNGLVPVTLAYMPFKYEALIINAEKYGKWVFDDIAEVWGKMVFKGATSFWETALGADDFDNAGSLCHGWSAIPVYYYHKYGRLMG